MSPLGSALLEGFQETSIDVEFQETAETDFGVTTEENVGIIDYGSSVVCHGMTMVSWYGTYGMVWNGIVWYGIVQYGMVLYGMVRHGIVWLGMVSHGIVWYWYRMVWFGIA